MDKNSWEFLNLLSVIIEQDGLRNSKHLLLFLYFQVYYVQTSSFSLNK